MAWDAATGRTGLTTAIRATVQVIKLEDLEEIITSDDAFFLYLQNFDTSVDDLVSSQ